MDCLPLRNDRAYEELAMGAISTGCVRVLNDDVVDGLGIPGQVIDAVAADELRELERRERAYRGGCPEPDVVSHALCSVEVVRRRQKKTR